MAVGGGDLFLRPPALYQDSMTGVQLYGVAVDLLLEQRCLSSAALLFWKSSDPVLVRSLDWFTRNVAQDSMVESLTVLYLNCLSI